ncbi:MAG TPA: 2-dehydropantoate 2-reductase [Anaerolineales bacterium]|jgi:2-dehydropantoate 2-reductase
MKNILIIGTGALATLFAGRLAATGASITLLGTWKNAIEAFNQEGARLIQADGSGLNFKVRATHDPADCKNADLALVLVKAWQTGRAAQQLAQCLPQNGLALTLQNGLGNREILSASLGAQRVMLGVTTTGATLLGPGLVRMGGEGDTSLEAHPRSAEVSELFRSAGMQVEIVADANSLVWGKLVVNAAINPLSALLGLPNGELLERPTARLVMAALARETASVASALGVHLPFADPVAMAEEVARRTARNRSSMFQDVKRGAPTEIDAICGAVVRAGERRGVPAPVNWSMWQLVSALQPG